MKQVVDGITDSGLSSPRGVPASPPKALCLTLVLMLAVGWHVHACASGRSVAQQLERMATALRSLSYEGILVYLHDGRMETLRIVHRVEDGRLHEQLESLNGPERTVTRKNGKVTCRLSDSHPISVRGQGVGSDLLRVKAIDPDVLSPHYLVHPLGGVRVAGRHTDVVGIIPRDGLRYGYRLYLDTDTGLPLRSDLIGEGAEPIEQIMFTSLNLNLDPAQSPIEAPEARPDPRGRGGRPPPVARELDWQFDALPAGFALVMYDHWADSTGSRVEHFVLSDGLASVSVYVENGVEDGLEGDSRIGAIHVVGGKVAGHQVTVVGEVPAGTVAAVLASISHEGGGRE